MHLQAVTSWMRKRKRFLIIGGIVLVLLAAILAVIKFGWGWTGFTRVEVSDVTISFSKGEYIATITQTEKTLWDYLNLIGVLAIPIVVGLGAAWYTARQAKVSDRQTSDNQRQAALQAYIDRISELLLKEHLAERIADGQLKPEHVQVRNVARVRTITILTQLNARRIGYVFAFLREAGLMSATSNYNAVSLAQADFHAVNWSQADLRGANLSKTYLEIANLSRALLDGANLSRADLIGADLSYAKLGDANLSGALLIKANLSGAIVTSKGNLSKANLGGADLSYAILIEANLSDAYLKGADLHEANLSKADLSEANLSGADLSKAWLYSAVITEEQLKTVKSLKGAIMPDGTKHQ